MEEWNFQEKYEIIEELLDVINKKREFVKREIPPHESLNIVFKMYDVMEKNALFIRDECCNYLEPATEEMMLLADKLDHNDGKLSNREIKKGRNAFFKIGYEQDCLNAMFMMNNELMEAFFKERFPEGDREPGVTEGINTRYIGPDVDFDKMPGLPSILKVSDLESKINRLEWLIDHFKKKKHAKIYLKARQDARKKYKEKVKKVPVSVHSN